MKTDDHWAANSDLYRILGEDEVERLGAPRFVRPDADPFAWVDDLEMSAGVGFWICAGLLMYAGLNIAAALIVKAGMFAGWW